MSLPIAVVICPGRGAYARDELGFIARHARPGPVADALEKADLARKQQSLPSIAELDRADKFRPGLHLDGENAAGLIYFGTLAHLEHLSTGYRIAAVTGNSLGWYTALAAAGSLSPATGWQLVATMGRLQKDISGGQVLTTTVDEGWQRDPTAVAAVQEALDTTNAKGPDYFVARSIRLGGHEVLAGTETGVRHLLEVLPSQKIGDRQFPFQLAGHGPFHSPLCRPTVEQARRDLQSLPISAPHTPLIDGRGNIHTPFSAVPQALLDYTISTQVVQTFDFTAALRTAIREFTPDVLLCPGPGTSLRAPVGHVVLNEGYRGIREKEALFASDLIKA